MMLEKGTGDRLKVQPVFRIPGPGEARPYRVQVKRHHRVEARRRRVCAAPELLCPGEGFNQLELIFLPPRHAQVVHRAIVDRKVDCSRAVLGCHVRDHAVVAQGKRVKAIAAELDELADHAHAAHALCDSKDEVGRQHTFAKRPLDLDADNFRQRESDWLADHHGFSLDATDSPTQHAQAVDHGGVAVGTYAGIRDRQSPSAVFSVHTTLPMYSRWI